MKLSNRVLYFTAGATALALIAAPAIASHGKAGLWNVTVTTNMGGGAMPDMSKLPPEAQAAMRAHGVTMNGNTMTVQHCMTEEEVNADHPEMHNLKECRMLNVQSGGKAFTADFMCSGQMQGNGHVEFVFDSAEHYTGKTTMTGTSMGHPVNMTTSMEGRWVGADCKGVTH
jgi:uncharacterized protein DUF3617